MLYAGYLLIRGGGRRIPAYNQNDKQYLVSVKKAHSKIDTLETTLSTDADGVHGKNATIYLNVFPIMVSPAGSPTLTFSF